MPGITAAQLEAQAAGIMLQAEERRKIEAKEVIVNMRELIARYGILPSDLFDMTSSGKVAKATRRGTKLPVKYRCAATGQTWTGRGRTPVWIRDKDRSQYAV